MRFKSFDDFKEFMKYNPDDKETHYVFQFWPNGNRKSELILSCKKSHGVQKHWYENGQPQDVLNFHKGMLHGSQMAWYDNGKREFSYTCSYGKIHGEIMKWRQNGSLQEQGYYESDIPVGTHYECNENGVIDTEYTFMDGNIDTITILKDGTKIIFSMKNGENVGIQFSNGKVGFKFDCLSNEIVKTGGEKI